MHQFTAVLAGRDAVGQHTLALDDLLRDMGAQTAIYATHTHADVRDRGRDFRLHEHDPAPDLIIYQASTGSPVADHLLARSDRLILNYHNMTPAEFFDPWEPHISAELDHGRRQLARLCRRAEMGIAVSAYNADELRSLGLDHVEVAPILRSAASAASADVMGGGSGGSVVDVGGGPVLLFVGRVAPNKCQQDLVAALAVLRRFEGFGGARLVLVGGVSSGGFAGAVERLAQELGVGDAVTFAGSVSEAELVGWFRRADVFVCVSEHEGFCVPLVEAMGFGVPVVAFDAGAVAETLGGAGVVLGEKSPVGVAEAVARVVSDGAVRERLVARGRVRAGELGSSAAVARMRELLAPLLAGPVRTP